MPGVIFEAFPRMGRAGVREISADRVGDSLPTDVPRRDPGRGPVADPMLRRLSKASRLGSPEGEPGTDSVVVTLP